MEVSDELKKEVIELVEKNASSEEITKKLSSAGFTTEKEKIVAINKIMGVNNPSYSPNFYDLEPKEQLAYEMSILLNGRILKMNKAYDILEKAGLL